MIHFALVDFVIVSIFAVIVICIGVIARRRNPDALEFFLAGRTLTLPLFVMTLVSTWYGGILGVGEYSYRYGFSNWVTQGVPYYIFALLFAVLMSKRVRKSNLTTIPDQLENAYGRKVGIVGALFTFFLTTPAPYMLMLGVLLQLFTGWSLGLSIFVGAALSVTYLFSGGFRSDVYTDAFEFVVMFAGFFIILPFCFSRIGDLTFLSTHLPHDHLTATGGQPVQKIVIWFLIALQTFVDPVFYQRCFAAKSSRVAAIGIAISVLFWILFDAMTTLAGLYARVALPELKDPMMSYPLLAESVLPRGAKGFFYAGMIATITSTLNSSVFVSGTTVGRDFISRWISPKNESKEKRWTQIGILVTTIVASFLALYQPSVVDLWYSIGSLFVPGLLLPLVLSYFDGQSLTSSQSLWMMWGGFFTALLCMIFKNVIDLEPMLVGLCVSGGYWIATRVRLKGKREK